MNSRFNHFLLVFSLVFTLVLTSSFLTSCGKNLETFTNATKSNYDLDSNDIAYIQFYIDPGIRLRFDETTSESEVTRENEVRNRIRKYEKSIDILPKTPGVATDIGDHRIKINFAEDLDLTFTTENGYPNTPYKLKSFNGKQVKNNSKVVFRDRVYTLRFGKIDERSTKFYPESTTPVLLYNFKSEIDVDKDREVIKGRTVN